MFAYNAKWFRALFRRRVLVIFLLLVQLLFLITILLNSSKTFTLISWGLNLLSLFVCLYIVSKKEKGSYKLAWIILILVFPLFGGLFYLIFHLQSSTKQFNKKIAVMEMKARALLALPQTADEAAKEEIPEHLAQFRYLQDFAGFPVYTGSQTKFLPSGEMKFEYLVKELEKAEKYIFLEYFIVQEGIMWDTILEILKRKAAEGVLVRLLYDDMGCFLLLPTDYPAQLKKFGIECLIFNRFRPMLSVVQNNRDHRKIVVIDGKTAFTGGINLADEYINAYEKYGHWKDAAVMIQGKAAWSFTLMFLQMWELCSNVNEDYAVYYPWADAAAGSHGTDALRTDTFADDGFVQPYADSPMDTENVGEHVYMQIINNATQYVYITTPYLIVDDSMVSALTLAAKSGVDVRIITPHKWDKFLVHMTTRSYYRELIHSGVKIYEYSKGFIHAKTFVSDDTVAAVGTTNLDFRSLYLHFECGAIMYKSRAVSEVKEYFQSTLNVCQRITEKDCNCGLLMRLFQETLRLFAPLM